ncbi:MAG: LysM peptidoglycan-binding domain-containing protein, partial [Planctomycetota bacterium]
MTLASQSRRGFLKKRGSRRYSRKRRRNRRISQLFLLAIIAGGIYTIAFWQPWKQNAEQMASTDLPAAARTVDARDGASQPGDDALLDDDPATHNVDLGIAATNALATHNQATERDTLDEPATIEMGTDPSSTGSRALRDALSSGTEQETIPVATIETPEAAPAQAQERPRFTSSGSSSVQELLVRASDALNRNSHVEARAMFNRVLLHPASSEMDRDLARDQLTSIAQLLTFSPTVMEDDPLAMRYTVRSGDSLSKIAARNDLGVDWRFIQRVNKI